MTTSINIKDGKSRDLTVHRNTRDKIVHKPMIQLLINTSPTDGVCVFVK